MLQEWSDRAADECTYRKLVSVLESAGLNICARQRTPLYIHRASCTFFLRYTAPLNHLSIDNSRLATSPDHYLFSSMVTMSGWLMH